MALPPDRPTPASSRADRTTVVCAEGALVVPRGKCGPHLTRQWRATIEGASKYADRQGSRPRPRRCSHECGRQQDRSEHGFRAGALDEATQTTFVDEVLEHGPDGCSRQRASYLPFWVGNSTPVVIAGTEPTDSRQSYRQVSLSQQSWRAYFKIVIFFSLTPGASSYSYGAPGRLSLWRSYFP